MIRKALLYTTLISLFTIAAFSASPGSVRINSIETYTREDGLIVKLKGTGKIEFRLDPGYYENNRFILYGDMPDTYCRVNGRMIWKCLTPPDKRIESIVLAQHSLSPPVTRLVFRMKEETYPDVREDGNTLIITFPPHKPEPSQIPLADRIVTIRSEGETLGRILMLLFEQYGANFIVEDGVDVNRKITLNLKDVPLKVALKELLDSLGYQFQEIDGGIIKIKPKKREGESQGTLPAQQNEVKPKPTRISVRTFHLQHISANKAVQIMSGVIPEGIRYTGDDDTRTVILSGDEGKIAELSPLVEKLLRSIDLPSAKPIKVKEEKPEISSEIVKINYTNPEKLRDILTSLLSPLGRIEAYKEGGDKGKTGRDTGSGTQAKSGGGYLIISDIPEVISKIRDEVKKLDRPPSQVEIQACIIERNISDENQLGLNWSFGYEKKDLSVQGTSPGETESKGRLNIRYGTLSPTEFKAVLKAISLGSDSKILSNPRITVLERQEAKFHSGDQVGFSKVIIQQGIETVETEFRDLGVVLTVSAEVKDKDNIMLNVDIQVSDLGEMTSGGEPTISTRQAQTRVLVKDGNTLVIGGLTSDRKIKSVEKMPVLGDIPILGRLFSNYKSVSKKTEVIVFITPKVINTPSE